MHNVTPSPPHVQPPAQRPFNGGYVEGEVREEMLREADRPADQDMLPRHAIRLPWRSPSAGSGAAAR